MLRTPARSEIDSPSAVNINGTPATRSGSRGSRCPPAEERRPESLFQARREIAGAELAAAAEVLDHGHEQQDQRDEHEQEVGRQVRLLGGEVSTRREHG